MSKSGPTRYRVPAALFLHHVQGHDQQAPARYGGIVASASRSDKSRSDS